jgi:uncharacterized protein (TIGR00375 family)
MDMDEITRFGPMKGLNLVGTGDFTHPKWFRELKEKLVEVPKAGLYRPVKASTSPIKFMITGEVSTIFTFEGNTKKIHNVILTPSLETAEQISDRLARYGGLEVDGRPALDMSAALLVEEVMEVSSENVVIPAHVWTPWFSLFGDFSGFDRIEDCYQDMTKHIHALETGLSSDPPMNWRLSNLDRFTLVSNSDCHSSWPWRIGREANVFELKEFTYSEVVDAIQTKDPNRFKFTIETYPDYGKYHWTGHRNCNVSLPPEEAIKFGGICPVCRRKLTKGVEQRVDELADRPADFKPERVPGYMHLLPLSEVIQAVLGVTYPGVRKVWKVYSDLVSRFGNEYMVLTNASFKDMAEIVDPRIAEAIIRVREERVKVVPGYDGVYGQIAVFPEEEDREEQEAGQEEKPERNRNKPSQKSLADYI